MIENLAVFIKGHKNKGFNKRRKKIDIIDSSSSSVDEAKAKVYAIINAKKDTRL